MLHRTVVAVSVVILLSVTFTLFCNLPVDPATLDSNVGIELRSDSTVTLLNEKYVFNIWMFLSMRVDSLLVDFGDSICDTIRSENFDTLIAIEHSYTVVGEKQVIATAVTATLLKKDTLTINVIKPVTLGTEKTVAASAIPV